MDTDLFLEKYTENLNKIIENEFKKYNYEYIENSREKKDVNLNIRELQDYNSKRYKSLKNNNINNDSLNLEIVNEKKEFDLFDSNNFNLSEEKVESLLVDFENLELNEKILHVNKYISRKKYQIEGIEINKVYDLLDDSEKVKKYIKFSKDLNQIVKIDCLKKAEDKTLIFRLENSKIKKKNIFK